MGNSMIDEADILWEIEDEHLREAEFSFTTREVLLDAPHYTLDELAVGPDERLFAHLDGLVVGGPVVAERLLLGTIVEAEDEGDHEKVSAAMLALLVEPDRQLCLRVLALLDNAKAEQRDGVVRALQLLRHDWIDDWLVHTLAEASLVGLAARLEALATANIVPGAWLRACLASDDLAVVRAAARLARRSRDADSLAALGPLAHAQDVELRRITLESALCRHVPGAWESAVYWALGPAEAGLRRDALTWVALFGDAPARAALLARLDDPAHRVDALWALGFAGSPAAVDRCIELLADDELGRFAAELVCAITGLPMDEDRFWRDQLPAEDDDDALPPLEQDDLDADLVPPPEMSLPVPEPESIAAWWHTRRGDFDPALRYLGGVPLSGEQLLVGLRQGPMRRRHALAFELAVRSGGASFIDTRGFCKTQRAQLDGLRELGRVDFQRGLPIR
jgi:uncharacterized protein (TIGR02270 family)